MRRSHRGITDFKVQNIGEEILRVRKEVDVLVANWRVVLASIAGISLLVGGIGIFSVMQISISERTYEIGLRKAMGATDPEIFGQFLIESVSLSLVGGGPRRAAGLRHHAPRRPGLRERPARLAARPRPRRGLRDRDRPRRRRLPGAARLAPAPGRSHPRRVAGSIRRPYTGASPDLTEAERPDLPTPEAAAASNSLPRRELPPRSPGTTEAGMLFALSRGDSRFSVVRPTDGRIQVKKHGTGLAALGVVL